jgi:hypothetical protein
MKLERSLDRTSKHRFSILLSLLWAGAVGWDSGAKAVHFPSLSRREEFPQIATHKCLWSVRDFSIIPQIIQGDLCAFAAGEF